MSSSHLNARAVALLASLSLALASGCHTTNVHTSAPSTPPRPVEQPPVVVVKRYTYVHYPSCNVYHDRERKLWFWFEAGEWKFGAALPVRYRVVESEAVTVELERETPYEHVHAAPQPVVEHGPSPHGNAYGVHRKFTYVHYPTFNVYCDRERKLWFWYEGGAWRSGAQLPAHFRVDEREAVKVELEADTPFEHGNAHRVKEHEHDARTPPNDVKPNGNGRGKGNESNHGRDKDDDSTPANQHGTPQGHGPDKSKNASNNFEDPHGNGKSDAAHDSNKKPSDTPSDDKSGGANNSSNGSNGNGKSSSDSSSGDPSKGNGKNANNGNGKGADKDKGQQKDTGSKDKGSGADSGNDSKDGDVNGASDDSNGGKGNGKGKGKG